MEQDRRKVEAVCALFVAVVALIEIAPNIPELAEDAHDAIELLARFALRLVKSPGFLSPVQPVKAQE